MKTVLHVLPYLGEDAGGPARAVPALCRHLLPLGYRCVLATSCTRRFGAVPDSLESIDLRVIPDRDLPLLREAFSLRGTALLRRLIATEKPALVHAHGLWTPLVCQAASASVQADLPFVLSPRGALSSGALSYHAWRKRLAWKLYARRAASAARLVHASSELERDDILSMAADVRVAVVPDGIESSVWDADPHGESGAPVRVAGPRRFVFLGRLHPLKGLRLLVDAWADARPEDCECIVAGPDERDHLREVKQAVSDRGLTDWRFVGPVFGEEKRRFLREADVFVLPSLSESFGVVVAEALCAGTPVIATTATPWRELRVREAGWWVEPRREALRDALRAATSRPLEALGAMGRSGRALVLERYEWKVIAQEMARRYDDVVSGALERSESPEAPH